MVAFNIQQHLDAADESARRQHAHITAVAADWLANVDRVIQQQAALAVNRNADMSRQQQIAGPGMSAVNMEVHGGTNAQDASTGGAEQTPSGTDPGTTPGVPEGQGPQAPAVGGPLWTIGRLIASGAGGAAILAGILWLMNQGNPEPTTPPDNRPGATEAGSMYQYLEDRDAHLPP